jgi:hypothetical protein
VPCFTLHDFDKNGFVMAATFPDAIDIGIRLADIEEWELRPEPQYHKNLDKARRNLLKNGATPEEADFIVGGLRNRGPAAGRRPTPDLWLQCRQASPAIAG